MLKNGYIFLCILEKLRGWSKKPGGTLAFGVCMRPLVQHRTLQNKKAPRAMLSELFGRNVIIGFRRSSEREQNTR